MPCKNETIELEITGMTTEGSGVGRYNGIAIFTPQTIIGERVLVTIVKMGKSFGYGKLVKVLEPSKARRESDCAQFSRCGGCVYRHMSYEEECRVKRMQINDSMKRIAKLPLEVDELLPAPEPDRCRCKAQLPCRRGKSGELLLGFYATHSHRIIDCTDCLLQPEEFAPIADTFRRFVKETKAEPYDETTGKGRVRHLYLRKSHSTGEIMVCIVVNGNGLHMEDVLVKMLRDCCGGITSIVINMNRERTNVIMGKKCRTVWGSDYITDSLCGLKFRISPLSFFQVNPVQAQRLYEKAAELAELGENETLLDLYCGTGTIGLCLARSGCRLIGVEVVEQAVRDAEENARISGIENARFICADASEAAAQLKSEGITPDVIVIDPPRKGCDEQLVDTVAGFEAKRIVYVSCDHATLARDLARFEALGYTASKLAAVDMFPRTGHVETVCLMSRKDK